MTIREKAKRIEELEKNLNDIVRVIEVIDPVMNDTTANDFKQGGMDMVRIPTFKSWLKQVKGKFSLAVQRQPAHHYKEMTLELSDDIIDSLSKDLCKKRDWYRSKIKEIEEGN